MNDEQLNVLLLELAARSEETEWLEFKLNRGSITNIEIGEYISALSNGACIKNQPFGYLVFGVDDKTHAIVGTNIIFANEKEGSQDLELWLRTMVSPKINFNIFQTEINGKHIAILRIPAAVAQPVYFKSKAFIRIGSHKTELTKYSDLVRQIYNSASDWSAEIVEEATISSLDSDALMLARKKYKERNNKLSNQIDSWSDEVFLDKAKLTLNGKITRAAIILLGKNESSHYLLPSVIQITWKLDTEEKAYEHFGLPIILTATEVADKIRNYKYKFFPDNELLATTVDKYERKVILEALYNCIVHQDYHQNSRIIVTEKKDKLIFENAGGFFDGVPEDYSLGDKTPRKYRNPWLAHAMVNLNMIDTLGSGIHTMYLEQSRRFFPLPQYDIMKPNEVLLTIYGHSIDENYSQLLLKNTNLPLSTIILLDRFQKGLEIPANSIEFLRKSKLITGRKPHFYLSEDVSIHIEKVAKYVKNKGFDKEYYKKLVIEYLKKQSAKGAAKVDINNLLWNKLPDILSEEQKNHKVRNLIQELRKDGVVKNSGVKTKPIWVLRENEKT